jgi:hypothetical protein
MRRSGGSPALRAQTYVGVGSGLVDKRAMGDRIIKRNYCFQMRLGRSKLADKLQGPTGGGMTQNETPHVVGRRFAEPEAPQTLRQIEFAADLMIE